MSHAFSRKISACPTSLCPRSLRATSLRAVSLRAKSLCVMSLPGRSRLSFVTARFVLLAALLAALLCQLAAAQDYSAGILDSAEVLKAAAGVTAEKYPNADDVLVADHIIQIFEKDGTALSWDDTYNKVLTEKGKRESQSLPFPYTLPYDTTVTLTLLQIIKPNGVVVQIDAKQQSKTMVDPSQMESNIYDPNDRILTVNVPGLENGDIVHYVSRRRLVKPRVPNTWSDYQVFEYTSPIRRYIYEVRAPKDLPLRSIALKAEIPGTVTHTNTETADRRIYRWEVRDVPRMYEEPDMPEIDTVVQRLLVSTTPDWKEISKWYWNLSEPHFKETPEMRAKVEALTKGLTTRDEKIRAIFRFVSQEVRYMGITIEAEAPGYEPHDVRKTFENRHGVCRDKAALLVAMLRLAGIKAYPVLIHAGPKIDAEVPKPYFNHAISAAESEDGAYILMDSTDETTKDIFPAYLSNKSYLVARPEGETLRTSPIIPAEQNMLRVDTSGRLDAAGSLSGESVLRFDGINDNAYRGYFSGIKPEERRKFFEGVVKRFAAGGVLTRFELTPENMEDTSQPMSVRIGFEAKDVLVANGDTAMFPVPNFGSRVGMVNTVTGKAGLEKRKYTLETGAACGVEETLSLEVDPALGRVAAMPDYPVLDSDTLRWKKELNLENGVLSGKATFTLKSVEFTPEQYLELKKALKAIEYNNQKKPIFARPAPSAQADSRILEHDVNIQLKDAHNWTETVTVRKEILTYKGKKDNAEIKFEFNPAWEEVKLDRATVTNDDVVKTISAQEVNLMDAEWTGAAKRYPGAKILVASLPGVETGSMIEYQYTKTSKGLPAFGAVFTFRASDPIVHSRVCLSVPESLVLRVLKDDWGVFGRIGEGSKTGCITETVTRGNGCRLQWEATNQPAVKPEDELPPLWSFNPSVFVSVGEWEDRAKEVKAALKTAVKGQKAAQTKANELTEDLKGPEKKINAIRDFVAINVRPAGPGIADLPLTAVTPADKALTDGYGNTTDRAVLLYVMLREPGLHPEFVLASSAPLEAQLQRRLLNYAGAGLFDTVLVRVKLKGEYIYLNDTNQYDALGVTSFDGRPGLEVASGRLCTIRAGKDKEDKFRQDYEIDLRADGSARVTQTRAYFGDAFGSSRKKLAEMPPEERKRYYQELVAEVSQSAKASGDLETLFDQYPGIERFTAEVEHFAVRNGDYLYLNLPASLNNLLRVGADERDQPLYWSGPVRFTLTTHIALPEELRRVVLAPGEFDWMAPRGGGSVTVRCEGRAKEGSQVRADLRLVHEVDLRPAVIPAEAYENLLETNRQLSHPRARTILLGKEKTQSGR